MSPTNLDFADSDIDLEASLGSMQRPKLSPPRVHFIELTEDGLATAFTELYGQTLKFCHSSSRWHHWNGQYWQKHPGNRTIHLVRKFLHYEAYGQKSFCSARAAGAIESLLRQSPEHAVDFSYWDRDGYLLGTPNGAVNLRTGRLLSPDPALSISKCAAVAPEQGEPKTWLQFLRDATNGDEDVIRYLQQICGYALTGSTEEHAMFFVYGPGGNGKSVFLNTLSGVLGDYSRASSMDTLTVSKNDRHPTELAMLRGARLVTASETEEGKAWAEAKIKQLTGSDPISARFMRQDFFEFTPQFKLIVVGNHAPQLRTVDEAIKRRFNFIPFMHKPLQPDHKLEGRLRKEWPQILKWMIEGCLEWQKSGLVRPAAVSIATDEYFEEQDLFRQWLEDCCDVGPDFRQPFEPLFNSWSGYAHDRGEAKGTEMSFRDALKRNGFVMKKSGGIRRRVGLQIKESVMDSDP